MSFTLQQIKKVATGDGFVETTASNTIIVIHPGSQTLRIGRASDSLPLSIPHCIARRHRSLRQQRYEDPWLGRSECKHPGSREQVEAGVSEAEEMLGSRLMSDGGLRKVTHTRKLLKENSTVRPMLSADPNPIQLTKTDHQPQYIVGQKALHIDSPTSYSLHWPIRNGRFNLHPDTGGSITSVLADLETIWSTIISSELDIPIKDLIHYRALVLVPDTMTHQHMKHIATLILDRLKFSALILHQESVCATYGAGLASACVVDIGDQKTAVSCVEDGISHKSTRIHLDYGGRDITRCFYDLLLRTGVPLSHVSLDSLSDSLCLQEVKEKYTHLDQDTQGIYEHTIEIHRPAHKHSTLYQVKIGDEAILAPLALFCPDMLGLQAADVIRIHQTVEPDPDDPYDEFYLRQTQRSNQESKLSRKKDAADSQTVTAMDDSQIGGGGDDDSCDVPDNMAAELLKSERMDAESDRESDEESEEEGMCELLGVDAAVVKSIEKCETDDKTKLYSCILVVGGGAMFAGAMSWLQYRVWALMSPHARAGLEVMDVINRPKDLDPRMVCWKGASLMASLDTTQELWLRQRDWKQLGVRALRERVPFEW